MLLALLIPAHGHRVTSSRAIERLCRRNAGYRSIVCAPVPDHTVSARFRRCHVDRLQAVFATVLRMCRDAGLIRLGLVVLDGTKVTASAARDANRRAATIDEQVRRMLADAQSPDQGENRPSGSEGRERLPPALSRREDRPARLCACKAKLESEGNVAAARQPAKIDARAAAERDRRKLRRGLPRCRGEASVQLDWRHPGHRGFGRGKAIDRASRPAVCTARCLLRMRRRRGGAASDHCRSGETSNVQRATQSRFNATRSPGRSGITRRSGAFNTNCSSRRSSTQALPLITWM
jgi:hypothetical protein